MSKNNKTVIKVKNLQTFRLKLINLNLNLHEIYLKLT